MQTPLVTMERSAMGAQQKHAILSNDLVRRLSMLSESIDLKERLGVIDHYTQKLKTSGYNQNQCKELIQSGVVGFNNKVKNRKKNGQPFYRTAKSTLGGRIRKKLTEKSSWYRKKKNDGQRSTFKGLNRNGKPEKQPRGHGTAQKQADHGTAKVEPESMPPAEDVTGDCGRMPSAQNEQEDCAKLQEVHDRRTTQEVPDCAAAQVKPDYAAVQEGPDCDPVQDNPDCGTPQEVPDCVTDQGIPDIVTVMERHEGGTSTQHSKAQHRQGHEMGGKKSEKKQIEVKTVIFIPQTENSMLAKMLREEETVMEKLTGYRVKYVEKAGTNLGDVLCRSDHWAGRLCDRQACLLCTTKQATGENLRQSCTKRNIVYEIWCQTCKQADEEEAEEKGRNKKKIKIYKYIGESAKSAFERGFEHQSDRKALSLRSHMLKHAINRHEDTDPEHLEFRMKVLKYHRSAFKRQVSESMEIKKNSRHHILNSK